MRSRAASRRRSSCVLNARGHGSGDDEQGPRIRLGPAHVLNARGHGSGDDASQLAIASDTRAQCSTPEGMGAATTPCGSSAASRCRSAQRPRAWERRRRGSAATGTAWPTGAQRPRAWERRRLFSQMRIGRYTAECSTPEGMGAATTRLDPDDRAGRHREVLNARGHGSGDDCGPPTSRAGSWCCAQRPRAWERRRRWPSGASSSLRSCAQRPRAWERRRRPQNAQQSQHRRRCSTPEGMGAATTGLRRRQRLTVDGCSTPEGMGAATTSIVRWRRD